MADLKLELESGEQLSRNAASMQTCTQRPEHMCSEPRQTCNQCVRRAPSLANVQPVKEHLACMVCVQPPWQACSHHGRHATMVADVQTTRQTCGRRGIMNATGVARVQPEWQTCSQLDGRSASMPDMHLYCARIAEALQTLEQLGRRAG
jgi:hypothetical protein